MVVSIARSSWKYALILVIVAAAALLAMFATGEPASAKEPNGNASCVGIEAASISPPESSEEVPGGMPELMEFLRGLDGPAGSTVKFIAGLREGSHEACDEAIEG